MAAMLASPMFNRLGRVALPVLFALAFALSGQVGLWWLLRRLHRDGHPVQRHLAHRLHPARRPCRRASPRPCHRPRNFPGLFHLPPAFGLVAGLYGLRAAILLLTVWLLTPILARRR